MQLRSYFLLVSCASSSTGVVSILHTLHSAPNDGVQGIPATTESGYSCYARAGYGS